MGDQHHWLETVIHVDTTLRQIDEFLRQVWMECCDHLSAFKFGELMAGCDLLDDDIRNTAHRIDTEWLVTFDTQFIRALLPGCSATHEYDFGSTSETVITNNNLYVIDESRLIVVVASSLPIHLETVNTPRWDYGCFSPHRLIAPPVAPRR